VTSSAHVWKPPALMVFAATMAGGRISKRLEWVVASSRPCDTSSTRRITRRTVFGTEAVHVSANLLALPLALSAALARACHDARPCDTAPYRSSTTRHPARTPAPANFPAPTRPEEATRVPPTVIEAVSRGRDTLRPDAAVHGTSRTTATTTHEPSRRTPRNARRRTACPRVLAPATWWLRRARTMTQVYAHRLNETRPWDKSESYSRS
jgi:hypothetical protein